MSRTVNWPNLSSELVQAREDALEHRRRVLKQFKKNLGDLEEQRRIEADQKYKPKATYQDVLDIEPDFEKYVYSKRTIGALPIRKRLKKALKYKRPQPKVSNLQKLIEWHNEQMYNKPDPSWSYHNTDHIEIE